MAADQTAAPPIYPVILCGGSGNRLWPLSRTLYPKQFLPLAAERTMLQETALRFAPGPRFAPPVLLCNDEHRFIVAEQLQAAGIAPARIVLEPVGRNTAPAACVAAMLLVREDADALMLLSPADHVVADDGALHAAIEAGAALARAGRLVTFGVPADAPHTGYGYIKAARPIDGGPGFEVARFVEKPDRTSAEGYLAEGGYSWNSGIFLFAAQSYLDELARHAPAMVEACRAALDGALDDLDFFRLARAAFEACPADSIDYAVMEKAAHAAVLPVEMGWNDVGSWDALYQIAARDGDDNLVVGDVLALDSRGNYLRAESGLVAALGVENLVVVATGDVVLVAAREKVEAVKALVDRLAAEGRPEASLHPVVYRPWGSFEGIKVGPHYQVKHLVIKPGAKISLQYHNRRAEHWVVVRGRARITRGDQSFELDPDRSTYIPLGETHRLENPGDEPLEVIEVQTGDYLGEDDIVRLEDTYGRTDEDGSTSA